MLWYTWDMRQEGELVTATVISKEFGIPVVTVYRMAQQGRLPYVDVTKDYHERKRYLFEPEAVRKALGRPSPTPATAG
jgi:hypothetical protein